MRIVYAGGTGFLGRHISRAWLDDGHHVTVLSRDPSRVGNIALLDGASAIRGDVTDPASLRGLLDGADVAAMSVQFPGFPAEQPRKGLTFDRYDRGGTENLLAEAVRAGVERFFYVSGVNVTPDSDKSWYRAKGLAERAIQTSGLRYAILRPSWAYGPEDNALNRIATLVRYSPVVPKLGWRPQRIQPVYVEDLAAAAKAIMRKLDAWDLLVEAGGPEVMTMTEVTEIVADVLGKRRVIVPVPARLARWATAPLDLLPRPPLNPGAVDFAIQDGLADNTVLEEVLGVHPRPLREGLTDYLT